MTKSLFGYTLIKKSRLKQLLDTQKVWDENCSLLVSADMWKRWAEERREELVATKAQLEEMRQKYVDLQLKVCALSPTVMPKEE